MLCLTSLNQPTCFFRGASNFHVSSVSVGASLPSWSLPLVYRQEQRRRFCLRLLVVSRWTPIRIGVFSEVIRTDFVHFHFGPVWKSEWHKDQRHLITHILKPFVTEPTENYRATQRIKFFHLSAHSSLRQSLVGQALACSGANHCVQAIERVALHIAVIQPEGEFINVTAKVFRADLMVDAGQSALEYRPNAFNSVHSDLLAHELAFAMVDRGMVEEKPAKVSVDRRFIGVNGRTGFNVGVDRAMQVRHVGVGDMTRSDPSAERNNVHSIPHIPRALDEILATL